MLTVVHGLEVIHQRQDILVAHGHPLQHRNLIPNLFAGFSHQLLHLRKAHSSRAYHMFPPSHESLVDHLCGIVSPSINVHAFFHDRIGASPQCFARFVSAWLYLRAASRSHGAAQSVIVLAVCLCSVAVTLARSHVEQQQASGG